MKIRYLDRKAVKKALDGYARNLADSHPELEAIILFGSFARGDSVPASDVDILLVLAESDMPFQDRIVAFLPSRFPIGMDVFPYTREEIEDMLRDGNRFVAAALENGIELFRRRPV
ncbi:MAG: nucleotidyltransferase domain-containing protein [Actinomycetota bacterium]|nr:nucleotidyltransferase domain-containing protein [Actinomycetota bacterium]